MILSVLKFEVIKRIGVFSKNSGSGWTKELNVIRWNDAEPKFDLRSWSPDHSKFGKGISVSEEEMQALFELMGRDPAEIKVDTQAVMENVKADTLNFDRSNKDNKTTDSEDIGSRFALAFGKIPDGKKEKFMLLLEEIFGMFEIKL